MRIHLNTLLTLVFCFNFCSTTAYAQEKAEWHHETFNFSLSGRDVGALAYSNNTQALVLEHSSSEPSLVLVNTKNGTKKVVKLGDSAEHGEMRTAISYDGNILAASLGRRMFNYFPNIMIMNVKKSLKSPTHFLPSNNDGKILSTAFSSEFWSIKSLAISSNNKIVAVGVEGQIWLWSLSSYTGKVLRGIRKNHHKGTVKFLAFSRADNSTLASVIKADRGWTYHIELWNMNTGELLHKLPKSYQSAPMISFHPHRPLLAISGSIGKGSVTDLWDVSTKKIIRSWAKGTYESALTFSPDGRILAVGDGMLSIYLYDLNVDWAITELRPSYETYGIKYISFSPNGQSLAVVDSDGRFHLWNK